VAINPRTRRRRPDFRSWLRVQPSSSPDNPRRGVRRRIPDPAGLPTHQDSEPKVALDEVIERFTKSWDRGEPVRAEEYLGLFAPTDAAELIYHEYCLAEAADLNPDPSDYLRRFPDHSDALGRLFSLHGAFSISTIQKMVEPADLPESGDEIGPYRLLRELGRGAFARVFLAEQSDLGDRLVVVKVSTRPSTEPTLLARARHANIVEVLRHADANDGALHLICMPFLGGATLGAVLQIRRERANRGRSGLLPRSGRDFLDDLDRASAPEYPSTSLPRPAREVTAQLSHPKALAWMVARLAEALDHAQRRGVTHGDIKPSNILITADGTPMLFDFNLAVDWHDRDALNRGTDLGGTLAYMAPERLRAIAEPGVRAKAADDPQASSRRPPDRHRADLYSLGLVLAEALIGQVPVIPDRRAGHPRSFASELAQLRGESVESQPALKSRGIPPTLRAILARCLAPEPSDRYARGGELAEDLDRWRSDRPLVYADEPARASWSRKARRFRYPILTLGLTATVALAVSLVASAVIQGTRRDQAMAKWSYILDKTEDVFRPLKFGHWRPDSTVEPAELATRHLAHYEVVAKPNWRERDDIRALPDRERGELEAWVLEQVLRRAVALGDRPNSPEDWRRALVLLEREIAITPLSAFKQQRTLLRERLGLPSTTEVDFATLGVSPRKPELWLESYLAGVAAEPLHARQALGFYLDALSARPDLFWAHYRVAVVACRIDEYPLATKSLSECVARRPDNKSLRELHGSTMYTLGRYAVPGSSLVNLGEAQAECDRALALDPDYAEANRTRLLINQISGQSDSVHADIERFSLLTRPHNPTESVLLQITSRILPGEKIRPFTETEEASLRRAIREDSDNEHHKATLADRLVIEKRNAEAVELYDQVIADNPSHLNARYQRAIELGRMKDPRATAEFVAMVDHPRFEELYRDRSDGFRAFHYIARDYLRLGRYAEAEIMVHRASTAINQSSALQDQTVKARSQGRSAVLPRGENKYNLARVNIAIAAAESDPSRLTTAIAYLKDAFEESPIFRNEWFAKDCFFDAYRDEILERIDSKTICR